MGLRAQRRFALASNVCAVLLHTAAVHADEVETRYGVVTEAPQGANFEGGIVVTLQGADTPYADDEALASFDFVAVFAAGGGRWTLYLEANTTPRDSGASALFPEANADAGTALDGNGNGRLQISEFHYSRGIGTGEVVAGLLDATGALDQSEVANDEASQFLSGALVNNPTIEFPDYALGALYHHEAEEERPGYTLLVSSSHGLADNPEATYSQLFDVGEDGKGVFAAAEVYAVRGGTTWRLGAWTNTADHAPLDGSGGEASNYGVYAVADGSAGRGRWNVRLGAGNAEVSPAASFVSVAYEHPLNDHALGIGVARTGASRDLGSGADDTLLAEVFLRLQLGGMQISPVIQWIQNSDFNGGSETPNHDTFVYGLRATYGF